jgi:hypothetical protein
MILTAGYSTDYSQFFQATAEEQETKRARQRKLDLVLGGDPLSSVSYEAVLSSNYDDYDYAVQRSDRHAATDAMRLRTTYSPDLPLLRGSSLVTIMNVRDGRTARENTAAYDTRERRVEADLTRPIGERVKLAASVESGLLQDFYDDRKLDRDQLRSETSLGVTYDPSPGVRARGSYTTRQVETVNIRRARAAQNQINEQYQIAADYSATLPLGALVTQSFQISADYTYFTYDEEANQLTRTNRVTSKITVPLWLNSEGYLEHLYQRSDAGAYVYRAGGTERAYSRGSETLRQYLKARLSYTLWEVVTLKAEEAIDVNGRRDLARGTRTRSDKRTFTMEAQFERELTDQLKVNGFFSRTLSTQEDDYWNIRAEVVKSFD